MITCIGYFASEQSGSSMYSLVYSTFAIIKKKCPYLQEDTLMKRSSNSTIVTRYCMYGCFCLLFTLNRFRLLLKLCPKRDNLRHFTFPWFKTFWLLTTRAKGRRKNGEQGEHFSDAHILVRKLFQQLFSRHPINCAP